MNETMTRAREVAGLWSWLPAFRAVAETEHLPSAAQAAHVSVSALSRTVALIEEEVGTPLFHRRGRRIELNEAGTTMLAAVRDAMRRVHDAIEALATRETSGPLRIGVRSPHAAAYVVPALARLGELYPELEPHLQSHTDVGTDAALLRGDLDLALMEVAPDNPEIVVERFAELRLAVYCGRGHALHGKRRVSDALLTEQGFVAPPAGVDDGWPADRPRRVSHRVDLFHVGLEICAAGLALAVLPTTVAATRPELRRVPVAVETVRTLYAAYREPMAQPSRAQRALEVLREQARVAERR